MKPLPAVLRTARAERAIVVVLGVLVLVTSFLVAAVPPLLASRYDAALRDLVATTPGGQDVTLTGFLVGRADPQAELRTDSGLRTGTGRISAPIPDALRAVTGPLEYTVASRPTALQVGAGSHPERLDPTRNLMLGWDPGVAGRVRYLSGRPPRNPVPDAHGLPVIEVGLAATTSATLRIPVGAELPLTFGNATVIVRVTGQYQPTAPGDRFWLVRSGLTEPIVRKGQDLDTYIGVGALDAAGYQAVFDRTDASLDFTWHLPVLAGRFTAGQARQVAAVTAEFGVTAGNLSMSGMRLQAWSSGLTRLLTDFIGQLRTAQTVLSLALAGLFAVAFGVLAIACRLLTERLRSPLATMRARGASLAQLCTCVGATMLLVSLPAAAAGYVLAALLVPGTAWPAGAIAVLAAATLLPTALTAWVHRRPGRAERPDLVRRRATPRQIVLEGLAVTLAIAGVLALRSRGLTTESAVQGSDPFLAVVPVLLGFAAGLLTLRGYPYPLRLISRLTARGRSAVPFIGVARAARQGLLAALPVIVLLLATAIAGFAGVVDSELHRAQQRSAWLTAGADARIDGQRLDRAALERVRRVPGVRDAVPARIIDSVTFGSPSQNVPVTLVAIDLAGYRRLVAGSPIRLPTPPRDGLVPPALLSPGLAQQIGRGPFRLSAAVISDLTVRPADTIDAFPTTSGAFVVVPDRPLSASEQPTAFFVRGTRLDSAQLHRAAGGDTVVTTRAGSYDALTGAPMVGLVRAAFGYGTLVVAGYGTLAILLTLIIGSSARGQTMSYLRTLGLSRSQAHRLAIVELGPVLLCAAIVGWAVGLLLPHVIGPAMDLRPYTGGLPATGYGPDPLMTMALAIGLIVFGGLAIAADTMISGRRQLGAELRMGAQS